MIASSLVKISGSRYVIKKIRGKEISPRCEKYLIRNICIGFCTVNQCRGTIYCMRRHDRAPTALIMTRFQFVDVLAGTALTNGR